MKKILFMMMIMATFVFAVSSCGDDDFVDASMPTQVDIKVSEIRKVGDKMFYSVTKSIYGNTLKITYNAYFNEDSICVKGEMISDYSNPSLAQDFYQEQMKAGNNPEIKENVVTISYAKFVNRNKRDVWLMMELDASSYKVD